MESLRRKIQEKKFYTTLPSKIDNAVEDYKKSIPEPEPELEWEFEELNEFGQDGWTISYRHKSVDKKSQSSNSSSS
tara:strand:- start:816 stop:1043 length:228 start_codon:yes stop_codon:yes gene_type:complete